MTIASDVSSGHRVGVVVLCLGGFTASLSQTMVIPAQSQLPALLDTSAANATWVITITLLASAVAMPIAGRLADMIGKKKVLAGSAAVLLLGSVVCALSSSLMPVLGGRVLQGLAMGFIPVGISMIRDIAPPESAGTSLAAMSATLGVGGAIGVPLSAWILQIGEWHAIFWLSAAAALIVLAMIVLVVPTTHEGRSGSLDVVGAIGLAIGLTSFLVGVSKGNAWGWTSSSTIWSLAGGIVALAAWTAFELRTEHPLVDLRTAVGLPVLMTNVAALAVGFGMMAQSIAIPQLLQLPRDTGYGLGQSVLGAGLWMAPPGLMMLFFAPISSRLIQRTGGRITLMIGATILSLGYCVGAVLMDAPWQLLVAASVSSAGVGIGYAAMPTLILDAVDPRKAASAVGVNSLMRMIGTTLAAAAMGAILTAGSASDDIGAFPSAGAFQACFVVGAVAALIGALTAAAIPRRSGRPVILDSVTVGARDGQ